MILSRKKTKKSKFMRISIGISRLNLNLKIKLSQSMNEREKQNDTIMKMTMKQYLQIVLHIKKMIYLVNEDKSKREISLRKDHEISKEIIILEKLKFFKILMSSKKFSMKKIRRNKELVLSKEKVL